MYSRKTGAEYLGISTETFDRLVKKGKISYLPVGDRSVFTKGHLDAFIETNTVYSTNVPSIEEIFKRAKDSGGEK